MNIPSPEHAALDGWKAVVRGRSVHFYGPDDVCKNTISLSTDPRWKMDLTAEIDKIIKRFHSEHGKREEGLNATQ
jgi:hypothetical protein